MKRKGDVHILLVSCTDILLGLAGLEVGAGKPSMVLKAVT